MSLVHQGWVIRLIPDSFQHLTSVSRITDDSWRTDKKINLMDRIGESPGIFRHQECTQEGSGEDAPNGRKLGKSLLCGWTLLVRGELRSPNNTWYAHRFDAGSYRRLKRNLQGGQQKFLLPATTETLPSNGLQACAHGAIRITVG